MDISTLVYSSCNDACLRLFCLITGLLYTIINYILTVICFFPRIEFTTDWGKVIRTLAMNPSSAYQKGIHLTVEINNDIVTTFSAIKATLISLGLRNCYF